MTRSVPSSTAAKPNRAGRRYPWLLAAGLLLAVSVAAGIYAWTKFGAETPEPATNNTNNSTAPLPHPGKVQLRGQLDVKVSEPDNPERQDLWLHKAAARPLKKGDRLKLWAELNQPAYVYIVWIDTKGEMLPVYPWTEGEWTNRPATEQPVQKLFLPEHPLPYWENDEGPPGMETLVLLARPKPLPQQVDLVKLLSKWEKLPIGDPQEVAWFENGEVDTQDKDRGPILKVQNHRAVKAQQELWNLLQPHFAYMRAVTFANNGGK